MHVFRKADISDAIRSFVNTQDCALVITTGGTGPARRDVTPEATLDVVDRELPGFGERMYGNLGIPFDPFLTPCWAVTRAPAPCARIYRATVVIAC